MKLIEREEELRYTMEQCDGCIVYGAGLVATCIVQYLIKKQLSSKIICIAVKNKEKNPESIMGIQVCSLNELECYRKKYLFLTATLQYLQEEIEIELKNFGCIKTAGISDTCYTCIREKVNDFTPDILCSLQKGLTNIYQNFIFLDKKIERMYENLTYLIEEQNEISDVNKNAFSKYRNCYRGKDIVIVATGPTLNNYKPMQGAIHIGVNTAYKNTDIPLDFLFVQDGRPEYLCEKFDGIEKVECTVFMGRTLKRSPYEYTQFPEEYRLSENVIDYIIDHVWPDERIYRDICHHPVSGGLTVTFSALHFALYTYPERIFLVGCDTNSNAHFDGMVDNVAPIDERYSIDIIKRYKLTKEFAQIYYPETEIISINPVGLKGIFRDIYSRQEDNK